MAILEDLSEEECYLWSILSDPSGLDQAEFSWTDSEKQDGCFRAWPYQWKWWRDTSKLQIDQAARCLKVGQLVLTAEGWKPIEQVQVGDLVLTHKNRWRRVLGSYDRGFKETVAVSGYGQPTPLVCTPDHKFWMRHVVRASISKDGHKGKKFSPAEWIPVEEWKRNDGSDQMASNWSHPAYVESLPFQERVEKAYRSGQQNYVENILNEDWLWLYGLYIAEGSTYSDDKFARITWSVHQDEVDSVVAVLSRVGLNYSLDNSSPDKCVRIQVNSRPMVNWLRANTGSSCYEKYVAPWVFGLDEKYRRSVFNGMVFGDGSVRKSGRISYTTTSKRLAYDLRVLAHSLGYSFSCSIRPPHECMIRGRKYNTASAYCIEMQELSGQKKPRCVVIDGQAWSPIYSVEPHGVEHVWDLEVEEDNSFVCEGVIVHNSVGKSLSIKVRAYAFPFIHPGQEMVITAPEGVHLDAITDVIETAFLNNRLGSEMLVQGRTGIKHRPFHMNFQNGARIMGRIPQRDGKGIKGTHPVWLELDEAQDYPKAGWTEIIETLKQGTVGSMWRAHGVTRGLRDHFYEFTQPGSGWKVHRITAMHRPYPYWSDEERQNKIQMYGSRDHPDYRRNVLGLHGDATNPLFVLHRLMACVDHDLTSEYNQFEYTRIKITNEHVVDYDDQIVPLLEVPESHKRYQGKTWIGMDVGFTTAPSAILVFGEEKGSKNEPVRLRLLTKIELERVSNPHQVQAILWLISFYRPRAFSMDKTGNGLPMFQDIQYLAERDKDYRPVLDIIKGYNFSSKILVDFDHSITVDEFKGDPIRDAGVFRNVLEYSSDKLRQMIDERRILLPFDETLIKEFQGQTWTYKADRDQYGRKKSYSAGEFHFLDAAKMAVLGFAQYAIETVIKEKEEKYEPVTDIFLF